MALVTRKLSVARTRWLVAGAAFIVSAASVQAHDAAQIAVRFEDLDLSQQAHITQLYSRLQLAASRVCRQSERIGIRRIVEQRACYDQALGDAVGKVSNSSLTALHANGSERFAQRTSTDQSRS